MGYTLQAGRGLNRLGNSGQLWERMRGISNWKRYIKVQELRGKRLWKTRRNPNIIAGSTGGGTIILLLMIIFLNLAK